MKHIKGINEMEEFVHPKHPASHKNVKLADVKSNEIDFDAILNSVIDEDFKDVPREHKSDFQRKIDCPDRRAALRAMKLVAGK